MFRRTRSLHPKSEKLFAAASRILPGGVDSPVRAFKAVGGTPIFIERGRGAHLEDVDGNTLHRLRDVVGTADPRPRPERPAQGARRGGARRAPASARRPSSRRDSAQRVAMLMPSMERVRFVSSGTEAAMSALRVARATTKRDRIIKFEGCYHGHADAFLVQAGSGAMTLGVPTSPGVPAAAAADTLLARYNDLGVGRSGVRQPPRADCRGVRRADRRQHGAGAAARRLSRRDCARSATAKARCWCSMR